MEKNPNFYWKLGKIPSFPPDFQKLTSYEQWIVGKTIEQMRMMKDPSKIYNFTKCVDCMDDLYLFGCVDDGVGNKGIEIQIYLDRTKNVLAPITVRKVTKPE